MYAIVVGSESRPWKSKYRLAPTLARSEPITKEPEQWSLEATTVAGMWSTTTQNIAAMSGGSIIIHASTARSCGQCSRAVVASAGPSCHTPRKRATNRNSVK